jgi:hypothetical protein
VVLRRSPPTGEGRLPATPLAAKLPRPAPARRRGEQGHTGTKTSHSIERSVTDGRCSSVLAGSELERLLGVCLRVTLTATPAAMVARRRDCRRGDPPELVDDRIIELSQRVGPRIERLTTYREILVTAMAKTTARLFTTTWAPAEDASLARARVAIERSAEQDDSARPDGRSTARRGIA